MQKIPVGASNRFVAEGIAGRAKIRLAARAVADGAKALGVSVAFTSSLAFRDAEARELELVAGAGHEQLGDNPEFRDTGGVLVHIPTGVRVRVHHSGDAIPGGPVCWPDPAQHVELFEGVPVLSINSFLDTEITRALNQPGQGFDDNIVSAILAAGISHDRVIELHPYVADAYHELWERAQKQRHWPAVA